MFYASKQWQVHVKWVGLDLLKASWEQAAGMATAVPKIMAHYLRKAKRGSNNAAKLFGALASTHPTVV